MQNGTNSFVVMNVKLGRLLNTRRVNRLFSYTRYASIKYFGHVFEQGLLTSFGAVFVIQDEQIHSLIAGPKSWK